MVRQLVLGLVFSSLLLTTACSKTKGAESGPSDQAQVKHVVTRFVEDLTSSGERNMQVYSTPFWADGHWVTTMEQLEEEIPDDPPENFPGIKSVDLRLYPVAHLDVLFTSAWKRLKSSPIPENGLKDVYVAAIMIEINGTQKTEKGWLLVRKVDGLWKVAGVVEN